MKINIGILGCLGLLFATPFWGVSCSTKGEQAAAAETAEQIENARIDGRETARGFINRHFSDSLEMQQEMVEAGTRRSRYDSLPQSREAFDSAFISTVRTVRPEVARELQNHKNHVATNPKQEEND